MRIYARTIWITSIISAVSLIGAIVSYFVSCGQSAEFIYDICLATFGSALLSAITSAIMYNYEKRRQMEEFLKCTKAILNRLNKYNVSWDDEKKMSFFLSFEEMNFGTWDGFIRDISFFFDPKHKKREYIFDNIYLPIDKLIRKAIYMERHFRYHKEALDANPSTLCDAGAMKHFISELEDLFIENITHIEKDSDGQEHSWSEISNKLVHSILQELNGRYYDIMYGRKADKE